MTQETRQIDFSQGQQTDPRKPVSGTQLNNEIDRLFGLIQDLRDKLSLIQRTDGKLMNGAVTRESLDPMLEASFAEEYVNGAALSASQAVQANVSAGNWAVAVEQLAAQTATVAHGAQGEQMLASGAKQSAEAADAAAQLAKTRSETAAGSAENWANWATQEANRAEHHELYAYAWAEYLGGPVEPAIPGDVDYAKAYDDGYWSAKWWALRMAQQWNIFSAFYLGPHETPPTTMLDGTPLRPGALYLNTTDNKMYYWDSADWVELNSPVPQAALHTNLVYTASQGQTVFDLSVPDIYGETYAFGGIAKPHAVLVEGHEIVRDDTSGTLGDYNVDYVTSVMTLTGPVDAGAVVTVRIYADADDLRPGAVNIYSVQDIVPDGTTVTFDLRLAADNSLFSPTHANELMVQFDGVMQRPGADFNVTGSQITFTEAPKTTSAVWMQWMEPTGVILLDGTFLQLQDTPASYSGHGNKLPFVAPAETGLSFRNVVESDVVDLDKYTKAEVDTLLQDALQWVSQTFSVASYAEMEKTGGLADLGVEWDPIQNYTQETLTAKNLVVDASAGTLAFPYEGVYCLPLTLNLGHNSSNQGRETNVRLYDVTADAPAGEGITIGIGRNQTATVVTASILLEVTAPNKNHAYRLDIGNGDTIVVTNFFVSYGANMESEWREIIPVGN